MPFTYRSPQLPTRPAHLPYIDQTSETSSVIPIPSLPGNKNPFIISSTSRATHVLMQLSLQFQSFPLTTTNYIPPIRSPFTLPVQYLRILLNPSLANIIRDSSFCHEPPPCPKKGRRCVPSSRDPVTYCNRLPSPSLARQLSYCVLPTTLGPTG